MNLTPEMIEAAAYKMAEMEGSGQRFLDDKAGKLSDIDGTYEGYLAEAAETLKAAFSAMPKPITLTYTNWRGETAERTIIPHSVWYGSTEWHPDPQWLLKATDTEKGAERDFALKDFGPTTPAPQPVAVKPLKWTTSRKSVGTVFAVSVVGEYVIMATHDGGFRLTCPDRSGSPYFEDVDTAKAAAQADYEALILSALTYLDSLREENERLRFEGDLDKWMKKIGAGISGYQPEAYAVIDAACDELVTLREENERLRETLEPFSQVLSEYDPEDEDDETPGTMTIGSVTDYSLTLGDFRRAAALKGGA